MVDTAGDVVIETATGGIDVICSNALDFNLGNAVEAFLERININLQIGDADLGGNDNDNTMIGNSGANEIFGRSGADILNGRGVSDTLIGGSGDSTFVVDTQADKVRDGTGQGVDLVRVESDFILPNGSANARIENLRMQAGKGNSLDNTTEGNTGDNSLFRR